MNFKSDWLGLTKYIVLITKKTQCETNESEDLDIIIRLVCLSNNLIHFIVPSFIIKLNRYFYPLGKIISPLIRFYQRRQHEQEPDEVNIFIYNKEKTKVISQPLEIIFI